LFRQFVRLGGSTTDQYGIGLGLSVAKAIIDGHGGQIGVDERPDGGSTFWFTLPTHLELVEEDDGESSGS
jgi:K+-sensing histidine kinase KdpD